MLWTRGLWFIVLELTLMQLIYDFSSPAKHLVLLLILWIFGLCMIAMAGLIHLPYRWLIVFSVAVLCLHDLLDRVRAQSFGAGATLWNLLHQPGVIRVGTHAVLVTYTLIPWIAVMSAGYCFCRVFDRDSAYRQRVMITLGLTSIVGFMIVRAANFYGDPAPWLHQKTPLFTLLSFLNCTKYPASLSFILMTLGPALLLLALFDRYATGWRNPLIVFGRVPMFFFIAHFLLIHILLVLASFLRYGRPALGFVFNPLPSMGGPAALFPHGFGYGLPTVYGVWALIVIVLCPVCHWFGGVKQGRKSWWLSYF